MNPAISAVLIAIGSIPIIWLSRHCLVRPSSHGFFRFFAFEAILALIALNAPHWFAHPFAVPQLISWFLLLVSLVPAISGFLMLRRLGKPQPAAHDSPEFTFENTSNLVTSGVYRYIRHPLYASLLFLAWGVFLKAMSPLTLFLVVAATVALFATAKAEEAENARRFGQAYHDYSARTRLFIPFIF
jgi:protein-S-isoprenylcysteine O-methyltransferase Ste14